MDDGIVPGRDDFPVLRFGRIPIRRDVSFGTAENHQRFADIRKILAMRIGTREMAFDDAVRSLLLKHGRQMTCIETGRARRDESGKRPDTHQRLYLRHVLDAKMIRLIHDNHRRLEPGWTRRFTPSPSPRPSSTA